MKISVEPYGLLPDGDQIYQYSLENNNGMRVEVLNYGGIITGIHVPDKDGKIDDVVLGHAGIEQYAKNPGYLGALVGRNCNRIAGAQVMASGKIYELDKNDGENNLHGGLNGLSRRRFSAEVRSFTQTPALMLSHIMEDMSDGFPGNLTVNIAYALTDDNALMIDYRAVCDQNTVINLTNHTYFNLAGHASGPVYDHVMQLDAPLYMAHKPDGIPTGELISVEGTPFDFRIGARLGEVIESDFSQIQQFGGIDHNMVLAGGGYRKVGMVADPDSGRVMEIFTDLPGVQLYTGNKLDPQVPAKGGITYKPHQGFCMETQLFPDAVHMPWLASPYFAAGEEYISTTTYKFSAK